MTRLRKMVADMRRERGRVAALVLAIAVSVVAVGATLGAFSILTREISASYLGTRPADATLVIEEGVDAGVVDFVRGLPGVREAEARSVVLARAKVDDDWRPILLFVVDDFAQLRLNTFTHESGAWPPPPGTMLVERSARAILGLDHDDAGGGVLVKPPHGAARTLTVSGVVHDPGLAPAWQERTGYAYVTRETLALLGEPAILDELRVDVDEGAGEGASALARVAPIEAAAARIAERLAVDRGVRVHQLRVPPPGMHPHQRQMTVILMVLLAFSLMALVLSGVLVATSLSALFARQVRETGIMKTIGARTSQLVIMYGALVLVLALAASALAIPGGVVAARVFAGAVSAMLNFDLASRAEPAWVFVAQLAAGIAVPLLVAAVPISSAARTTVREAIDRYGAAAAGGPNGLARARFMPAFARAALRRPGRFAWTLALLAAGGAMFMTALDVEQSWNLSLAQIPATRFYDAEVRLNAPAGDDVIERLRAAPGVERVEAWGYTPAAFARAGELDVVRSYPDRGHGSLMVLAPPPSTRLVRFPLQAGRFLRDDDDGGRGGLAPVVLNHSAYAQWRVRDATVPPDPRAALGRSVDLSLDGVPSRFRLVGVVEEIGAAGVAYVADVDLAAVAPADARRVLRVVGKDAVPQIEAVLASSPAAQVEAVLPLGELRTAIGDHILILIRALLGMAAVMGVVGVLGLASTLGTSVVERTREIGVLKVLGATRARVRREIVLEAVFIAVVSGAVAFVLSLPLSFGMDALIGDLGFLAPLRFAVALDGMIGWAVLTVLVAALAALLPAWRASVMTPHDALAEL